MSIPESPYAHFNRIMIYDASGWRKSLESLEKEKPDCWDIFVERQQLAGAHQMTRNIPLIWNEQESTLYDYFEHLIEPLENTLTDIYGVGHIRKLLITNQPPSSIVFRHRDADFIFHNCHRCHIVLETGNTKVYGSTLFYLGRLEENQPTWGRGTSQRLEKITERYISETVPMCIDEMWEINNVDDDLMLKHSVINYNKEFRKIHIIFDWKPQNYLSSFHKKPLDRDRETVQ